MSARPVSLPASPWRAVALLALAVLFAHLALLGFLPAPGGPKPLPLANKFITRTIEITPPAPARPAVDTPLPAKPRPPAHRRRPPSAIEPTAPASATPDAAAPAPSSEDTAPDIPAQAADGNAAAASSDDAGPGGATSNTTSNTGDTPGATQPIRLYGSVRLAFDMTGQRGPQQWTGAFGELVWLQDGDEYNAQLSLRFLFKTIRNWTSIGRIDAGGVAPTRFSETRRSEVASHFVRDQGLVVFSNNAPSVPLQAGAQDRLSIIIQLGALLAGDPARYAAGSRIAIQTVGPRDADVWVFEIGDEERVQVPAGEFTARRLWREPRHDHDYRIELWLAPELGYLPVQLRQTQPNDDSFELHLQKVSPP